jgi:predicted Zn-dependent protease
MKDILKKALSKFTGTYADIRYEENRLERLAFNKRELQDISMQTTRGGHVRVLRQGGWGTNSFIELPDTTKASPAKKRLCWRPFPLSNAQYPRILCSTPARWASRIKSR